MLDCLYDEIERREGTDLARQEHISSSWRSKGWEPDPKREAYIDRERARLGLEPRERKQKTSYVVTFVSKEDLAEGVCQFRFSTLVGNAVVVEASSDVGDEQLAAQIHEQQTLGEDVEVKIVRELGENAENGHQESHAVAQPGPAARLCVPALGIFPRAIGEDVEVQIVRELGNNAENGHQESQAFAQPGSTAQPRSPARLRAICVIACKCWKATNKVEGSE